MLIACHGDVGAPFPAAIDLKLCISTGLPQLRVRDLEIRVSGCTIVIDKPDGRNCSGNEDITTIAQLTLLLIATSGTKPSH